MFSPMTSFTGCPKTSLTLPCERSEHGRSSQDGLEDDGRKGTTGEVCGGSASAGEGDGRVVSRVRHLASGGLRVAAAVRTRRDRGHRRAQPASAAQPPAETGGDRTTGDRAAASLSRLGARKLRVLLQEQGVELARNIIHRILLRHQLVRPEDQHEPAVQRFERSRANELWQMDFKGPKLWHQPVGPLSVLDDHSRYLIALQAVGSTRSEVVREQLETAFLRCGVPEQMLMDHGVPWWSARSSGGMTELSLWLMRQGVELHWSRVRHPQTQGKVERFHGELQRALARRRVLVPDVQAWLDEFRWEHNHVRPHEALGWSVPPVAGSRASAVM